MGIELELLSASARDAEWSERLEREEVDVITDNYWRLQVDRARGVPFVSIATASDVFPEDLFVHPSITSIDDLRGKKMAIRPVGPQFLFPRMWLADNGLDQDVDVVAYPESETGRWGHWKPVATGECHACFITDLYTDAPTAAGLKMLPLPRVPFADGYVTLTTTEGIIGSKRTELQALVSAAFEASRIFVSDRAAVVDLMREECLPGLGEHFELKNDHDLERLYEQLVEGMCSPPLPSADGIINAYRMQVDAAPEMRGFNPLLMWDLSFAREAMRAK
jgi:NMT1/THI5 like